MELGGGAALGGSLEWTTPLNKRRSIAMLSVRLSVCPASAWRSVNSWYPRTVVI